MGRQQVYLDAAGLRSVADGFDAAAAAIDSATRIRLGGLVFDGSRAGRDHVGAGESVRRSLDSWAGELTRWSRASTEIAAALRAGAARYACAELSAADRLG
ncbi:type VII secretion target [Mycolicibacter sp. MYC123]|uniref:Type VII secretion target n=1 Tax=[Mycobacterium] zoologicum TaxID=2872311 RepID=A0ABU5YKD6_9MYCO|nr:MULTISPECIES: type VII secretion target [unclassified Mycolicibacter]MEB3050512.1 type VII secretion target [Mycolicibacter sp. MYC123]MEB3063012.1 type VII secretion target [Mycolicibacter sp. MYC101]